MWWRAALCTSLLAVGCSGSGNGPVAPSPVPVPTTVPSPPAPVPFANWQGDATVVSKSGTGGCGWGLVVGTTRTNVGWSVGVTGALLSMYEDMGNWPTDGIPYTGTVSGQQFTASYVQPPDGVCQFAGATLTGTFSADFNSFEAEETVMWGPGGGHTRVTRRWHVRKF